MMTLAQYTLYNPKLGGVRILQIELHLGQMLASYYALSILEEQEFDK